MSAPRPVFFVSDGTGITAETIGHTLLTQFSGVSFATDRIPFVDTPERAAAVAEEIRALSIRAFQAIDCQGLARVDFFLTDNGPVINELNTMPGFTTISMYPRMWAASGVDYPTLLATMVETAVARGTGLR